jgi:hypothetical protein
LDILTVAIAFGSFGIFLLVHLFFFRRIGPEHLFKSLLKALGMAMLFCLGVMTILFMGGVLKTSISAWLLCVGVALVITGQLCGFYVLCFFGPYETSVRMRLIREIAQAGAQGISAEKLLSRYNAIVITDLRLKRLLGSGDIVEKDGQYEMEQKQNFFFILDAVASILKKVINLKR